MIPFDTIRAILLPTKCSSGRGDAVFLQKFLSPLTNPQEGASGEEAGAVGREASKAVALRTVKQIISGS